MSLTNYRQAIRDQLGWTNRALENRCRPTFSLSAFTKTPLRSVLPAWRDNRIGWAKRKHHRAQARSSLCNPVPTWIWNAFLCIHSHEGAWTDYGDPYWGGLQMDRTFMAGYGSDMIRKYGGYAHLWSPMDQIIVGYRAWKTRGFYPWPLTARMCGLL